MIWFHCAPHGGKSEQVDDLEQVSSEMPEDELDDESINLISTYIKYSVLEDFNSVLPLLTGSIGRVMDFFNLACNSGTIPPFAFFFGSKRLLSKRAFQWSI